MTRWRGPAPCALVAPGESIQAALENALRVVLDEGAHVAPSGLTLRSGQWFSGVGPGSQLTLGGSVVLADNVTLSDMTMRLQTGFAAHGYAVRAAGITGAVLRHVEIDGNVAAQSYGPADNGQSGLSLTGSTSRVLLDDCHLHSFGKDCVYVDGAAGVRVSRSTLRNFARGGVTTVGCDGLSVEGCLFAEGGDLPTVIGNHGVWLEPNVPEAAFRRVSVRGCTFRGLRRGLYLHNNAECENDVTEEGNDYSGCAHAGVWAYYLDGFRSRGSLFDSCGLVTDSDGTGVPETEGGLVAFNCTGARLDGHRFRGCGGHRASVYLGPNTRGCWVEGNTFDGDQKSAIYAGAVSGSDTRRRYARNYCANGSMSAPATYAAIVLVGTSDDPIDSDDVVENTVDASYAAVRAGTQWTGGRDELNHVPA